MSTHLDWEPPTQLDEFRLLAPLGRGAMGQVYVGLDTILDRQVAVKFIAAQDPAPAVRKRFLQEARAIARLQHPNVVSIYRVGEFDGHPYLVSELIQGQPLSQLDLPLPYSAVSEIALEAASGLAAAHRQGVLHKDIKPANLMRTPDGHIKLLDFGLAVLDTGTSDLADGEHESGGTPRYMAPEVRKGDAGTAKSDVYSLGCVLFELCTGYAPILLSATQGAALSDETPDSDTDDGANAIEDPEGAAFVVPPLANLCRDIPKDLASILDRCLKHDPNDRYADGATLWDDLLALHKGTLSEKTNPYRGLLPFGAEHRAVFFGRTKEVTSLLERLRRTSLLVLSGGSGVGKSSLCYAGLLPLVQEGKLHGQAARVVTLTPGRSPVSTLRAAVAPLLEVHDPLRGEPSLNPAGDAAWDLAGDPAWLVCALRRVSQQEGGQPVLLFVDQLEEIFTLAQPQDARLFAEILGSFAHQGQSLGRAAPCIVLCALRADYLPRLLALPGLGKEVTRSLELLPPLPAEAVREAIVAPARAAHVRFSPESLVTTLVESTLSTPSGVPLLQFALAQLWERRDPTTQTITEEALAALGGVAGALASHAEEVFCSLSQPGQEAARRLLLRLLSPGGTLLRRGQKELCQDDAAAVETLEVLVQGRLISATGSGAETAYELAHDSLLLGWQRLRTWLDTGVEVRKAMARVEAAALEWERLGRSPQLLLRQRQLIDVAALDPALLRPKEAEYLQLSRRRVTWHKRRRAILGATLGSVVVLSVLGLRLAAKEALDRRIDQHIQAAAPVLHQARAAQSKVARLSMQAFLRFDQLAAPVAEGKRAAEALFAGSLASQEQAERNYADAIQSLEAGLLLDPSRDDIRERIAEALFARIELAERSYRRAEANELGRRLSTYDKEGSWRAKLQQKAVLEIGTNPDGAELKLLRYEETAGGRRLGAVGGALGTLRIEVPAGSYLLQVHKEGHVEALLPLLLSRGQPVKTKIELPSTSRVPPGFVYVPEGDFLYGSADDEDLRQGFFNTQPLHPVHTQAFLIGRTEVTFADWMEFLSHLPKDEEQERLPRGQGQAVIALKGSSATGFALHFQFQHFQRVATTRQSLVLEERQEHARQTWQKWPVSGISLGDAQAYLRWLHTTRRLPGARLCDEREWERAARGADGRRFPHGDRLAAKDANYSETYGRRPGAFGPDEVGSHPTSTSPFGVLDLSGNVWELTTSAFSPSQIVFRGGGWYYERAVNRVYNRESIDGPPPRDALVGLRVCASL